jgi:spore maturation protein CgeB
VILGLSIRSSWGNGHATTYRALVRALARCGHRLLFLERDVPWYAANCDMPQPPGAEVQLYSDLEQLRSCCAAHVREADLTIVGSYTPEGIAVGDWVLNTARGVTAFYDIDTPITLQGLAEGRVQYISKSLLGRYGIYLSFTGGPVLKKLRNLGAQRVVPLYCSVDPADYFPEATAFRWDLGYMGTYSKDRAASLEQLLIEPARKEQRYRMVVAGPQYPSEIEWPVNVDRMEHLSPREHRGFYASQRFTLNVTRQAMKLAGFSPSVRLFEAGACGSAIISDYWPGLEEFFTPQQEIILAETSEQIHEALSQLPNRQRIEIGKRARERVLAQHTADVRARQLEQYLAEARP